MNMYWFYVVLFTPFVTFAQNDSSTTLPPLQPNETDPFIPEIEPDEEPNEEQRIINETIAKYGPPKEYKKLGLPGPEILDTNITSIDSKFSTDGPGIYTLKVRTLTDYFSYNGRYEEAKIVKEQFREFPVIKGQFGEHIEDGNGNFYIRTIGYTLDENGYEQFLIDLTKATILLFAQEIGGPDGGKPISSTVLATLIGGNSLG